MKTKKQNILPMDPTTTLELKSFEILDDEISCDVRNLKNGKMEPMALDELFYEDSWLKSFSVADIRKLSLLAANQIILKDKLAQIDCV